MYTTDHFALEFLRFFEFFNEAHQMEKIIENINFSYVFVVAEKQTNKNIAAADKSQIVESVV